MALGRTPMTSFNWEVPSVDSIRKDTKPSMLYSILPVVFQNHIPTLPSIRRSLTDVRSRGNHAKSPSTGSEIFEPATPPPRYFSRQNSSQTQLESGATSDTEEIDFRDDLSERERPISSGSLSLPPFPLTESETGISWRYANQGISLMTQAYQESNALARDAADASAVLTRQLYIHAITYLLRGLPSDLSQEETLSLQAAIPECILELQNDTAAHAIITLPQNTSLAQDSKVQNPSILHQITATIVFHTFVMIQFLLPYIKVFAGHVYQWEQEHRVTRRIFNTSISTMDELGRRSVQLSQAICRMNDGKVGQAVNDLTFWWVRGLTGGIQQGISEGVFLLGGDENQGQKGRTEKAG
ncbi:hypothetical protein CC78DRAFT_561149 [Lojkania enalia]|uniref:Uncharacterized protein n=1 Tax=Lojkania enalia TaxID=147567 RepID=A0A9P4K507_9PLEO|nr:hypothetical protein CC78DRAFT_561149 [Didymosphaeria enalia]